MGVMPCISALTGDEPWLNTPIEEIRWEDVTVERGEAIVILALRSLPYEEYLQTEHWATVRRRVLIAQRRQCLLCSAAIEDVHHWSYKRKGFEHDEDVKGLCRAHHAQWHATWRPLIKSSLR